MCELWLLLLLAELAVAAPFVTTWRTTTANEAIILPPITTQSSVNVNWGDTATQTIPTASTVNLTHTYASAGSYNVSIDGQILWGRYASSATKDKLKLMDIVSWGDGFLVNANSILLFDSYSNLTMSAPGNTQPAFLPGAVVRHMFSNTRFNSALDWDLTNVSSLDRMFASSNFNQPLTFRNTKGVTSLALMFHYNPQFNQPFHFDASGVLDASYMFANAPSFNQVVNLTNSSQLTTTVSMFAYAESFNQPLIINTDSVTTMSLMFSNAYSFNQPVNFNTSRVNDMNNMFANATSFNQPINFNTPKLIATANMFSLARSFNQPVVMNTSIVIVMSYMFSNATSFASTVNFTSTAKATNMDHMFNNVVGFTQDLSEWNTSIVTTCSNFCPWCGLPNFPACSPCPDNLEYTNPLYNLSMCSNGTRAPTAPSSAPSVAPSPAGVSVATVAGPSLFLFMAGLFLLGF